ncbi:OmpA family protein [Novosphingobium sp. Chol11]|uniref:OmpA family protein n=1 Tax=Novosphingobium sp. Chol11 TaxID=1385763 RepID=UPI0025F4F0A1|nr:OmpA family protein [Novosphingobium sp. Chol11]
MRLIFVVAIAGIAIAAPSAAQSGPVAQQSPDQLVCQLTGDCDAAPADSARDKPASRGFSIAKPGAKPSPAVAASSASTPSRPAVTASRPRPQQPSGAGYGAQKFAISQPGRANLLITFVKGSADLTAQAKVNASQFVAALASPKLAGMKFAIEGHTDAVGDRAYNLDLSQRRAQAVVDFLASKSVDKSRFTVAGYGFDRPLNPRNPRSPANRRVEVVKAD